MALAFLTDAAALGRSSSVKLENSLLLSELGLLERQLITMHTLLEAPFGDENVEGRLVHAKNDAFRDEIAINLLSLLVHLAAGLNVNALLLSVLSRVFLGVARLNGLDEALQVLRVLDLTLRKRSLELTVDDDVSVAAGGASEMSVQRQVEGVVRPQLLGRLASDEVLGTLHRLEDERLHSLANVGVINLEKAVVQAAAAGGLDLVANRVHAVGEGLQASGVGWALSAEEGLLREGLGKALSNIGVGLVHELLDELSRGGRVKDVMLDGDVLIIKLLQKPERRNRLTTSAETGLGKLLGDSLCDISTVLVAASFRGTHVENLDILELDRFMLPISLAVQSGVNLINGNLGSALDDTLADPSITLGNGAVVRVDTEKHTDSEALFARCQRANLPADLGGSRAQVRLTKWTAVPRFLASRSTSELGLTKLSLDVDGVGKLRRPVQVERDDLFVTEVPASSQSSLVFLSKGPILQANAAQHGLGELVGGEVVVAQKSVSLHLKVAHAAQLLDKCSEGMQRSDRPALNAGHEDAISVVLVLLDEVAGRLLGRNGNERHALVGRLEPDNLGLLLRPVVMVTVVTTISGGSLGLLLLLGSLAAGSEQAKVAREHLAGNTLNDGHDVAGVEGLASSLISSSSTRSRLWPSTSTSSFFFWLDGDQVTLEGTVAILATANEDISIEQTVLGGNVGVAAVLLVHTKDARNELSIAKERRKSSLREIRSEKGLSLLLLLLVSTKLTSMLTALETNKLLAIHLCSLKGLQLLDLHGVKLLAGVHAHGKHGAGHLHQLRLTRVLESSDVGDGLVDGTASAVARLEAALVLRLVAALIAPVAVKVARTGSGVAATGRAASATKVVLVRVTGEAAAACAATATTVDGHALAATMPTASTTSAGTLSNWGLGLGRGGGGGGGATIGTGLVGGTRHGELEARCCALLLGNFCRFLRIGKCQGVTSLVTTSGTTAATSTTTGVFPVGSGASGVVVEVRAGSARGGSGRRAQSHVGKCRLITAM
ncbi:hypothetical protein ColLi_04718 [Colletotrichum liriopes]|uniref:Uncharacterized protein n=1 Tax=Colletotrichum liriopes TaxID=708192 RepID=A0AA37LRT7_9PEZI|nr:hypothetical protein ColLi_04718 [Colletotrichum liriopes]